MSQSRRGAKNKRNPVNEDPPIELSQIVQFLRVIASMTGALFLVTLLCYRILPSDDAGNTIYVIVIGVNLFSTVGSQAAAHFLDKKDRERNEEQKEAHEGGRRRRTGKRRMRDAGGEAAGEPTAEAENRRPASTGCMRACKDSCGVTDEEEEYGQSDQGNQGGKPGSGNPARTVGSLHSGK